MTRAILVAVAVWVAVLVLRAIPAPAHDHWINQQGLRDPGSQQWCCGENDCEDLTEAGITVTERADGYLIGDTAEVVPRGRVLWKSPEGHWWRCHVLETGLDGKSVKKARCLIGPPPTT